TKSRRRRLALHLGGLAAVLVLAGVGVGVLSRSSGDGHGPTVVTAAASVPVESGEGITASVTASGTGTGRVMIEATIDGLQPGGRYELAVVTSDGTNRSLSRWTATAGVQDIRGSCTVPLRSLSFFTISVQNGGPVVSVHLTSAR